MPVYLVKSPAGDRMVEATSKNAAIKHVVGNTITAEPVTTSEMAALIKSGVALEEAAIPTTETKEDDNG